MDRQLLKSHRLFGYEVGRMPSPDAPGKELVVLRTDPSPISGLQVAPAHTLMPATAQEVLLRFRLDLHNALDQALFFGASREELYAAAEAELCDALASLAFKISRAPGAALRRPALGSLATIRS